MKKLFLLSFVCIMAISLIAGASDLTNNPKLELAKLTQGPNWISAAKSLPTEKKADEANKVTAITGPALNLYPILDHKVPEGSLPTYIRPSAPVRLASDMETVILSEGFEADTLIPAGWTDSPGTSRWRYNGGTSGSPNPGSAHTGNYAAFFNIYGYTSGTIDTLISPSMDLSTYSGSYALSFWGWDGVDPNNYVDSAYFILCENGVNTTYLGRLPITDTWTKTTFQFSSNSTAAQIKIVGYSNYGYTNPYIDDIVVEEFVDMGRCCSGDPHAPTCADLSETACSAIGGTWIYGISCATDPCVPTPLNDECFEAEALTGDYPQSVTGTTIGATIDCPDMPNWSANYVWYTFDAPYALNKVSVSYCPSTATLPSVSAVLYPNCPGAAPECSTTALLMSGGAYIDTCPNAIRNAELYWDNLPGPHTYYMPVQTGSVGMDFAFDINVTLYAPPVPDYFITLPAQLPYGDSNKTTCGLVDDYANTCLGSYDSGPDAVYEITLTAPTCLEFLLSSDSGWAGMALSDHNPLDGNCLAYASASSGPIAISGQSLAAGTYYLMVDNYAPYPDCIDYTLTIRDCAPPPANDDCVNAIAIPSTYPASVTGTTSGATVDCPDMPDWSANYVWYTFDVPYVANNVHLSYCPSTATIPTVAAILYPDCPGAAPECSTTAIIMTTGAYIDTCPNAIRNAELRWDNLPGPGTYYLPVQTGSVGMDFAFELNVTVYVPPVPDYTVTLPAALPYSDLGKTTCGMTNDFINTCLGYYDGGPDAVYELIVTAPGCYEFEIITDSTYAGMALSDHFPMDATCLATATNYGSGSLVISGQELIAGTYYLMIDDWPSPPCINYDLYIRSCTPPPANDSCQNAQVVGNVNNLPWTTTYATPDSNDYIYSPAIWYQYTATSTATVLVSLCGSSFDTRLQIFEGTSCDPLGTMIAQDDDSCDDLINSAASYCHFSPTSGQTYLIQVGGYSTYSGNGVLTIEAGDPAFNVTPTSVSGTAPLNGSYTDTLTVTNTGTGTLNFTVEGTQDPFLRRIRHRIAQEVKVDAKDIKVDAKRMPEQLAFKYTVNPRATLSNYLVEDFEVSVPPASWTAETTNTSYTWGQDSYAPYSGTYYANVLYDYSQYERLISPPLDFSTATTDLRLEFAWYTSYYWMVSPYNNGNFELWISIDGGATWSDLLWAEDSVGTFNTWQYYFESIDLSPYIGQSNVKLSWLYEANDAAEAGFDMVTITDDHIWLSFSTSGSILPGGDPVKIPVVMNGSNMAVGTYTGNIHFETNDPLNATYDVPVTFTITGGGTCEYLIGDISGDGNRLGGDVTYGVRYFKGIGVRPPDSCYMDSTGGYLYVAGDCNGNCEFRGSDITRLVAYFKGNAQLSCCHWFPTTLPPILRNNHPADLGKSE